MVNVDLLGDYMKCEKCNAALSELVLGGRGDWWNTIQCRVCFYVREGVNFDSVLVPLVARQKSISEVEARDLRMGAQEEYLVELAKVGDFG